jgi:RNase H-like domain found in reverse transcriptase/Integrase zinc binding domain/Chromo (CHRromatin Organisation MOdifier) domain
LDDLIVHAPNFTQYLANLREVFQAARERKLTFNPKKSKFLEPEVKALGLTLSAEGIRMSDDKIRKALDFPVPVQGKHLKSYVGLANYFRDFIPMYTRLVSPLNGLLKDYKRTKNKKIPWNDTLLEQYHELQQALNDCQQLYFVDDYSPIYLMTDASDYGYGAYLCQIVEGVERPVAFNSKSFSDVQSRWSTVEQECFAIYSALMEWRCLLEGRKFTIRTDHANLRYMQESPSDKVNRWKLAYQHFDATIEHLKGSFNRIADGFSRLVKDARIERGTPNNMRVAHLCMCLTITDRKPRRSSLAAVLRYHGEIPADKRALIAAVHNSVAGHMGVQRTREALNKQGNTWKGMNTHIRQYLRECPYCQKTATKLPQVQVTPYTVSSRQPMTVRAIDTLGPFPEDEDGYTHIVSIIDMFSRFLCLYPVKDTTAEHCVQYALMPHVGIFGTPLYLVSDNGQQFVADLVKQFNELVGTIQVPITPYSHEENSLVERSHLETLRHVRALVYDHQENKHWRKFLPLVQRIVNAQDLPAIGCTPNDMLFGKAIDTNQGIFLEFSKQEQEQLQVDEYLSRLCKEQARLIKRAEELLHEHHLKHNRKVVKVTEFPVGSYVLVQYPPGPGRRSQPPTKLHTNLKGPLRVVKHEGANYWLQDIVTGKTRKLPVHVSRLVPFKYNPTHTSPKDVARRDLQEFYVHEILQHRYTSLQDRKTKGNMEFLVSWLGYGPEWNSWEPWRNLRAVKALHRYLARTGLASLIPTEFRRDDYDVESSDSDGDVLGDDH